MTFRCPSFRAGLSPHVHHNHSHREIKPRWSILHNKHRVTRVCFNQKPWLSLLQISWCDWCSSETLFVTEDVQQMYDLSRFIYQLQWKHSSAFWDTCEWRQFKAFEVIKYRIILFRLSIFSYVIKEEICTIVHFFYRVLIKCTLPFKICMIWFCINLIS